MPLLHRAIPLVQIINRVAVVVAEHLHFVEQRIEIARFIYLCTTRIPRPPQPKTLSVTFLDYRAVPRYALRTVPRKKLKYPHQVIDWLHDWGGRLSEPASMILIGSGGLLWHIARIGQDVPLPENSMDVDPVTESDAVAELAYDALIGSEFESRHGWHVNLMPRMALDGLPENWTDLLAPKLRRNEPRDQLHAKLARELGLL